MSVATSGGASSIVVDSIRAESIAWLTSILGRVTHQGPWQLGRAEPAGIGLFAAPYSFSGQPAMSIPVGLRANGTPIGIQLVAAHGGDALLLHIAAELEKAGVARVESPSLAFR